MNKVWINIRMIICYKLLGLVVCILPKNDSEGVFLLKSIATVFQTLEIMQKEEK